MILLPIFLRLILQQASLVYRAVAEFLRLPALLLHQFILHLVERRGKPVVEQVLLGIAFVQVLVAR